MINKEIKKPLIMIFSAALIISTVTSAPVSAHKKGCGAKTSVQKCGTYRTTYTDQHHLHTNVYCSRTAYIYDHYYVCAGCGVKTGTGTTKACFRNHQYCPTEKNLCK